MTTNPKKNTTPAEEYEAALAKVRASKIEALSIADALYQSELILCAGERYWQNTDPSAFTATTGVNGTAISYIHELSQQAERFHRRTQNLSTSAGKFTSFLQTLGPVTSTASEFVYGVKDFNPGHLQEMIDYPTRDDEYARKFTAFDPELGRLYRAILEARSRIVSHPTKSTLPLTRQAYDHLMAKLAPDAEIQSQPGWPMDPNNPTKPAKVTRKERLEFAANKHIKDVNVRKALIVTATHVNEVHNELSELFHAKTPIDINKAQAATEAMLAVLNQWADALGL